MRMIFHHLPALISVGTEVTEEGDVYVAIAACNRKDQPERRWANKILNARLDSELGKSRFFMGNYAGEAVGPDVFGPIRDSIRGLCARRNVEGLPVKILESLKTDGAAWKGKEVETADIDNWENEGGAIDVDGPEAVTDVTDIDFCGTSCCSA